MEHHLANMHYVPAPSGRSFTFQSDQDCAVIGLYVPGRGLLPLGAAPGPGFHPGFHLDPARSFKPLRSGQVSVSMAIDAGYSDPYLVVVSPFVFAPLFSFSGGSGTHGPAPVDEPGSGATQEIISDIARQENGRFLLFFKSGGVIAVIAPSGYAGDYPQPKGAVYSLPAGWALG